MDNQFKGTVGPWVQVPSTAEGASCDISDTRISDEKRSVICTVYPVFHPIEDEYNAQLLQCAPETLDALRRLILAARPHMVAGSTLSMRIFEAERAVIKATTIQDGN